MRILLSLLVVCSSFLARASGVEAQFIRAHDGDTILVDLPELKKMDEFQDFSVFWSHISVRLAGVDTPEIHGQCNKESAEAQRAKALVEDTLTHAHKVTLNNLKKDKYFRLLADIYADDVSLSELLLNAKLAVPYDGGTKEHNWCAN